MKVSRRLLRRLLYRVETVLRTECPDQDPRLELWDYSTNDRTDLTIKKRMVLVDSNINIGNLVIKGEGAVLVFKDSASLIKIRAKSIKVEKGGQMWVGSRSCRYQGKLDIALYGNREDMPEDKYVGTKWLWAYQGGTLEIHGKEKLGWSHITDHVFADSVPVNNFEIRQNKDTLPFIGNRLVFHILSPNGDIREITSFPSSTSYEIVSFMNGIRPRDIILCLTDGFFPMNSDLATFLQSRVSSIGTSLTELLSSDYAQSHSQFAFIYRQGGDDGGSFILSKPYFSVVNQPLRGDLTIELEEEKTGFELTVKIETTFPEFNINDWTSTGGIPINDESFRNSYEAVIKYTSPLAGQAPIVNVEQDISSWEVGDTILIASTDMDPRHSEQFQIVACPECTTFQVKLNRPATHTHWGRVDSRNGLDQRAEIALLSRNVRFYGEMSSPTCRYASTRESLNKKSPNKNKDWCSYISAIRGSNDDLHGAHMIFTKGFENVHVSHLEVFNAGQPRLARYPVHWHQSGYVGNDGGYDDPASAISVSIHHCFSRFITVHGTHEAIVKNNVGYDTHGHGFFFEDGFESGNTMTGNLGVFPKPGIILPSDRHQHTCEASFDGFPSDSGLTITVLTLKSFYTRDCFKHGTILNVRLFSLWDYVNYGTIPTKELFKHETI